MRKTVRELCVAKAVAKIGARVETDPSIKPARPGKRAGWSGVCAGCWSGAVGVGYGLVMVGTLRGEVVALDAINGEEKWRSRVNSEVLAPPASNGDVVVVQTQDDRLIGLDASTGNQRWVYDSTPAVLTLRGTSAPIVTNRLAVAGLSTGKVVALDISNGVPVWEQRIAIPQGRSELERVVDIDGGLVGGHVRQRAEHRRQLVSRECRHAVRGGYARVDSLSRGDARPDVICR